MVKFITQIIIKQKTAKFLQVRTARTLEQKKVTMGKPSDIFSIGIVIYEMIKGQYPLKDYPGTIKI